MVELFKFLLADKAHVALITDSHDVLNILICHRVVKMISEDPLQVLRPDLKLP